MTRGKAKRLRELMERLSTHLTDSEALEAVIFFPDWEPDKRYAKGDRYRFADNLYVCLQDHTAQSDWTPEAAPSLWAKVLIPDPTQIPEWEQPDSTNPYAKVHKVTHNGKIWISTIDGNVWEPGVAGTETLWKEVSDAKT